MSGWGNLPGAGSGAGIFLEQTNFWGRKETNNVLFVDDFRASFFIVLN